MSDEATMEEMTQAFFQDAKDNMFPKLKSSALSLVIGCGDPDPKLCMEIGAAILFDKPLIVLVPEGKEIPLALAKIATRIVYGNPADPVTQQQLTEAILFVSGVGEVG